MEISLRFDNGSIVGVKVHPTSEEELSEAASLYTRLIPQLPLIEDTLLPILKAQEVMA